MPNHYYGYNPDKNTVNSNQDNFQDDVYRPPLGDMSTNPSSPLFQAMNNQRGDTFRQFEANQDGAESYINNLNPTSPETPLGVALSNRTGNPVDPTGTATVNPITTSGGRTEPTNRDMFRFDPFDDDDDGEDGVPGDDGDELKDPVDPDPDGDGRDRDGDGRDRDGDGRDRDDDDDGGNKFRGTELESILTDYNVDELQRFYGNVFDQYDSTLEAMQNREFSLTDRDIGLQRSQAQLDFDRRSGQLSRDLTAMGRQEDVLGRQIDSLGRREDVIGRQIGALGRQEDLLQSQYDMAAGLDQAAQDRLALQREGLTDRQGDVAADYDLQQAQLGLSQLGIEGAQEDLATNFALQQRRLGLQRGDVEARQGDIDADLEIQNRLLGIQREDQLRGADMARSQARGSLFDLYDQSQQNTGGFAGSGARDAVRDRAIANFAESAQNRISSLSDTRRLDIAGEQAQMQRDRQYRATESQLSGLDIAGEQAEARRATQERGLGLQLGGLEISKSRAKNARDRQLRSLGSQLSGLDITDSERQLRFDQQQGTTLSRIEDVRDNVLNAQGAIEDVRGNIANVQGNIANLRDNMTGIQDEQSYLQSALDNTLSGFDIARQRAALGTDRNIFNLRSDYEDEVRGRLIDIIRGGGDLSPFKLSEKEKEERKKLLDQTGGGFSSFNNFYSSIYNT